MVGANDLCREAFKPKDLIDRVEAVLTRPEFRDIRADRRDPMTICNLSDQDREIVLRALWNLRIETGRETAGLWDVRPCLLEAGLAHLEVIDALAARLGGRPGVPIYGAFR